MTDVISLTEGDARLDLRPQYGGRISRLAFGDWDVLRPIPNDETDVRSGYKGGSFPLVPFSNRIKDAKFLYNDKEFLLDAHPNEPGHAMHGHGCFNAWTVDHLETNSATLSYDHPAGNSGWPWRYQASQSFQISSSECRMTITVVNTSDSPMPLGLGFHPFFPFDGDVKLRFNAATEWLGRPEELPTERREISNDFSPPGGTRLWQEPKTVCYDGFEGEAEVHWTATGNRLRLTADGLLTHFIVHVAEAANYFCLEPVSHPTDGFNLAARGVEKVGNLVIAPGQSASASMALIRE